MSKSCLLEFRKIEIAIRRRDFNFNCPVDWIPSGNLHNARQFMGAVNNCTATCRGPPDAATIVQPRRPADSAKKSRNNPPAAFAELAKWPITVLIRYAIRPLYAVRFVRCGHRSDGSL